MLIVFSILSLLSVVFGMSFWVIFLFCLFGSIIFLFNYYTLQNSFSVFFRYYYDEVSFFIVFILFLVIFTSFFYSSFIRRLSNFLLILIFLCCFLTFSSCSLFFLYLGYELSLVPIIFIIVVWGSYPERSLSSMMLLFYTSIFTIPFLYVLWFIYYSYRSFLFYFFDFYSLLNNPITFIFRLLLCLVFLVKLPLYGLHFWLPIAHVEAPTHGSMVLAGVLLKLGGVGLIRCFSVTNWYTISNYFFSYFLVCLVFIPFICSYQSDFKRLVAYSSVSHIVVVPILLCIYSIIRLKTVLLVLLFHGLSSPLLFSIVGFTYKIFSTRQLVSIRSLHLFSPLFSFIITIGFFFTLCIPPFPSFVSEAFFFLSSLPTWSYIPLFLVVFSFLSLVYNLLWFSNSVFSSFSSSVSFENCFYSYLIFFSMFILILTSFVFVFVFYCFC